MSTVACWAGRKSHSMSSTEIKRKSERNEEEPSRCGSFSPTEPIVLNQFFHYSRKVNNETAVKIR